MIECVYCYQEIITDEAADPDDDDEWIRLTEEHHEECEWVLTRAHTLPIGIETRTKENQ